MKFIYYLSFTVLQAFKCRNVQDWIGAQPLGPELLSSNCHLNPAQCVQLEKGWQRERGTKQAPAVGVTPISPWQSAPHSSLAHYPAGTQSKIVHLTQEVTKHCRPLVSATRIRKPRKWEVDSASGSSFTGWAWGTMLIQLLDDKEVVWGQENAVLRARVCAESKCSCSWDECNLMWKKNAHAPRQLKTWTDSPSAQWCAGAWGFPVASEISQRGELGQPSVLIQVCNGNILISRCIVLGIGAGSEVGA